MTSYRATLGPWTKPVDAPTVGLAALQCLSLFDAELQRSFLAGRLTLRVEPVGAEDYPALSVEQWRKVFKQSVKGECRWKAR